MFLLCVCGNRSVTIEEHTARAGCTLIESGDEFRHRGCPGVTSGCIPHGNEAVGTQAWMFGKNFSGDHFHMA
jgi:hypothetical protein